MTTDKTRDQWVYRARQGPVIGDDRTTYESAVVALDEALEEYVFDIPYEPIIVERANPQRWEPATDVDRKLATALAAAGVAPPAPSDDCPECGDSMCRCDVDWTPAAPPAPSADREATLNEYREAYESWKSFGTEAHTALLEIWHLASSTDTAHMTFGDQPQVVVDVVREALADPAPVDEAKLAEVLRPLIFQYNQERITLGTFARAVREHLDSL